jgi:hypothetical protein
MNNPKMDLLVTATIVGDAKFEITGYYHWDCVINKHFVVSIKSCIRQEVFEETVKLVR